MPLIILKIFTTCLLLNIATTFPVATVANTDGVTLESMDGKHHAFNEYIGKGKWTVLNIWGARCPPCRDEMPDLVQFHDEHKDSDAIVLGIAIDFPSYAYANKQEVLEFSEDFMIDFPVLLSDGLVTLRLGLGSLEGLPTTYLYTPEGKLVGKQIGGITKTILEDFMIRHKDK